MAKITVTVSWTKETDNVLHGREKTFSVTVPVPSNPDEIEDLMLSFPLPPNCTFTSSSYLCHNCQIPGTYKNTPSDIDLLNTAKVVLTEKYTAQAELKAK